MPFSLGSYLLGVGTVVGALTCGFGGGVLLTHSAMKASPAGQTKIERLARVEPETLPASQDPSAEVKPASDNAAPASKPADGNASASIAAPQQGPPEEEHSAATPPNQVAATPAVAPRPDAARNEEPETPGQVHAAKEPTPVKQVRKEPGQPKQAEKMERNDAKPVGSRETERARRYAERRQQRRLVVQEEPAQEIIVARPPERQHLDLFGGRFGGAIDASD